MNENLIYEYERILTDSNKVTMDTFNMQFYIFAIGPLQKH